MTHLNLTVYLRALKQGLQLLPYTRGHRIFNQCQFNHQVDIARAQYSYSSYRKRYEGEEDRNKSNHEKNEDRFDRKYEGRADRFDRKYEGMEDRFDRKYEGTEDRFDRKYEGRADRFDRKFEGKRDRFNRNYERKENRFDRKYEGREDRFDRKYEGKKYRFDPDYDSKENRFDRKYEGKKYRFDPDYESKEDRFDQKYESKGRYGRNESRFDKSEHREGRFDQKYGGREDKYNRNYVNRFDRNEGRFDRSYGQREDRFDRNEGRFDRSYGQIKDRFDRNEDRFERTNEHREDRFERKYGGREDKIDRNYKHRINTSYQFDRNNDRFDRNYEDRENKFDRNHEGKKYNESMFANKSSSTVLEFDEYYDSNEDFQEEDFDVPSDPEETAFSQITQNYRPDGAFKRVRFDQPRSSAEHEKNTPTWDLEPDIDNLDRNEIFAEKKSMRRSQSDPQINSLTNKFSNEWEKDIGDKEKWKETFGTLSDMKYDKTSDEDLDEEFIKPHRRLSAKGRKNTPVWYALKMKHFGKIGQIDKAVEVLENWMLERDRVQPDYFTFSILIAILAKAGRTEKAFKMFNKMKKMGFYASAFVYSSLFTACANSPTKQDGLQRAVKLRLIMKEKEWEPNYITSTAMIKAFGKCGDLQTCFEIMDDICVRYPQELDSRCFSMLLSACSADQQNGLNLAIEVWHKMQEIHVKPTGFVYNSILKAVRDCHFQPPNAENSNTFIEESDGPSPFLLDGSSQKSLVPRENLPNVLIEKHIDINGLLSTMDFSIRPNKLVLLGGADSFLHHMKKNKVKPDIRIFSLLLDCSEHTVEAENELLEIMKLQNVRLDQEFCNSLIRRRALRRDNDDARAVLPLMTENLLQPNMETLNYLALTCHRMKDGLQLLKDVKGLNAEPTLEVFSNLFKTSGMNFHYKTQLLIEMENLNLKPDTEFIISIEKCIQKGKQAIVKLEDENLRGEDNLETSDLQSGFKYFMKHYSGWLHRTNIDSNENWPN